MQTATKKPTFEVRLIGPDLSPEVLSLRAVGDVLSAVQDLASGRDPYELRQVPAEKGISLSRVRGGSAVYTCVSRMPSEAKTNLTQVGQLLASMASGTMDDDRLISALRPLELLSEVAKSIGGTIEVALTRTANPLFVIVADVFSDISKHLLLSGETTIVGQVLRAGAQRA